jgi:hypothetical protein
MCLNALQLRGRLNQIYTIDLVEASLLSVFAMEDGGSAGFLEGHLQARNGSRHLNAMRGLALRPRTASTAPHTPQCGAAVRCFFPRSARPQCGVFPRSARPQCGGTAPQCGVGGTALRRKTTHWAPRCGNERNALRRTQRRTPSRPPAALVAVRRRGGRSAAPHCGGRGPHCRPRVRRKNTALRPAWVAPTAWVAPPPLPTVFFSLLSPCDRARKRRRTDHTHRRMV